MRPHEYSVLYFYKIYRSVIVWFSYRMMKVEMKKTLVEYTIITLASILYAVGFNWFFVPNYLPYGGITGLVLIADYLLDGIPVGTVILICNIPIFVMGWKLLGRKMLYRSLYAMSLSNILLDVVAYYYEFQPVDEILGSIYGGVVMGLSMGIILTQSASTGGTDLLSRVIRLKIGWIPVGQMMLIMDVFVVGLTAVVKQNMDSALYGMIAMYITAIVMDHVTFGVNKSQVAYIISEKHDEVLEALLKKLNRGVTVIPSIGGWSGVERPMIMCAFRHRQIVSVKNLVREVDPDAFIISCAAFEVLGRGFRMNTKG